MTARKNKHTKKKRNKKKRQSQAYNLKCYLPLSEAGTSRFHFLNFSPCARKFEKIKLLLQWLDKFTFIFVLSAGSGR